MQRVVDGLSVTPRLALIDGNRCPQLNVPSAPVIQGDGQVLAIAAASILAKVSRDREMRPWISAIRVMAGWHKVIRPAIWRRFVIRPTPIHRRSSPRAYAVSRQLSRLISGQRLLVSW